MIGTRRQATTRIAVLIPVYNAPAGYLARTLASVDRQDGDFDIIVVDDGSVPAVGVETASYDHAVDVVRLPENRGIVAALNEGLALIYERGYCYVVRQDAGDADVGDRIGKQAQLLDADADLALVGAWVRFNKPDGSFAFTFEAPAGSQNIARRMRYGPSFIHPATMMRVAALREVGGYRAAFPHCEDYDLFFRLTRRFKSENIQEVLVDTVLAPEGISIGRRRSQVWSRIRIQLAYFSVTSPRAWLGVLRSALFLVLPYRLLAAVKARRKTVA